MFLVLFVLLALVLLAVSVLGFAGLGPLTADRRSARAGLLGTIGPAVGLLASLGLLAVAMVGTVLIVGLRGGDDEPDRERAERPVAVATTTTTRAPDVVATQPANRETADPTDLTGPSVATLGPHVVIEATDSTTFPTSYPFADGLRSGTVLQVRASGFPPDAGGIAEQCARVDGVPRCFNLIPVRFDAGGAAQFQYLVAAVMADGTEVPGACRAGAARCTVVVRGVQGVGRGEIQTVFGDELPPPGRIEVSQVSELALAGESVVVSVRDYPAGTTVIAMLCAAPDASGVRCGAPGPTATIQVRGDGTGRTRLRIVPGAVGSARAPCGRGDECGISVASEAGITRAPVVPITFAAPPGAAYDSTRLALGLLIAAILLVMAAWLIKRTDWSAVGEAAAPEIDDAEYADLDAIIAALPPEEDELVTIS